MYMYTCVKLSCIFVTPPIKVNNNDSYAILILFTEEENQLAEPQVNTAIVTVSTLLAVIIMMVGIYFAMLISCKVAKSKKRYTIIIWSLKYHFLVLILTS